jgi:hypothetical protein
MVGLDLLMGLKKGGLFALRWKHFDEEGSSIRVEEAVYEQ